MKELRGGCLCGAVGYAIADALQYAGYCHCSECRRFSGSAFSAVGGIRIADFRLVKGVEAISRFEKSADTVLAFCRNCGSSLYAEKPKLGLLHLRLGTLHDAPRLKPQFHVFVGSKAPWHDITDQLPQFEARRPPPRDQ